VVTAPFHLTHEGCRRESADERLAPASIDRESEGVRYPVPHGYAIPEWPSILIGFKRIQPYESISPRQVVTAELGLHIRSRSGTEDFYGVPEDLAWFDHDGLTETERKRGGPHSGPFPSIEPFKLKCE